MLYMVIERYKRGPARVYERAWVSGRMLPEGLRYLDSWIVDDGKLDTCFQLMETDDPQLLETWRSRWDDLVSFEIKPVIKSGEAAARSHSAPAGQPAAKTTR
jgi:hypothetical protein